MIEEYDASYYHRQEAAARDLAARTFNVEIRRIHTETADKFAQMAQAARSRSSRF